MPASKRSPVLDWWTESFLPWAASFGRSLALVLAAFALILAIAIGSGVLGTVTTLAWRRLPYEHADSLLAASGRGFAWPAGDFLSDRVLRLWKVDARHLADVSAFRWTTFSGYGFKPIAGARVSTDFFQTLGVRAELGRVAFEPHEQHALVLSYEFWRNQLGGDRKVLGRRLDLDGEEYHVAGVLPPEFWFVTRKIQVWAPAELELAAPGVQGARFGAIVRLKPGVRREKAAQDLWMIGGRGLMFSGVRLARIEDELLRNIVPLFWFAADAMALVAIVGALDLVRFALKRRRPDSILRRARFDVFLLAKTAAAIGALTGLWLILVDPARHPLHWGGGESLALGFWLFGLAACGLVYWSLIDQRYRCRVCLRRLRMPVPTGSWGTPLLNRPGTEYICPFGHGKVNVASSHLFGMEPAHWTYYGDFWQELVQQEEATHEE
jgi:hypothetical protein